jgi:hypothetical protein
MLDVHFPTTDGRTLAMSRFNADQKLLVKQLKLDLPPQPHHASQQQLLASQPPPCSGDLRHAPIEFILFFLRVGKVGLGSTPTGRCSSRAQGQTVEDGPQFECGKAMKFDLLTRRVAVPYQTTVHEPPWPFVRHFGEVISEGGSSPGRLRQFGHALQYSAGATSAQSISIGNLVC